MLNFNDIFVDDTKYGMKIPKEKYLSVGLYPVIDQSKEQIAGYTDESEGIYCDVPAIIFGDHTRIIKYIDVPFFLGADGTKLLKIKDNTAFNCKYLYYALSNAKIPNTGYNRHFKWLKELSFNIPSIEKQREIADLMDIIVNLENLRKKQLEKLELFVKSRFIELFGDPVSNTKNIPVTEIAKKFFVTKLAGFEYTKYIKYQDSGDVIMVRGLNVKDKKLKLDDVYYIDSEVSDKLPRSQLKENDIVMTYVGVNIGDVALVDAKNKYHLAPNVAKISPYDINETNPVFFVYLLAFNKEHFAGNATNTAKQALNMEKIRKLQIILPKIELQNQFADFVAQVDKSKLAIQQSLDELETLKKSLMQQYFG
jgi:type I restriction enzyme S subunit